MITYNTLTYQKENGVAICKIAAPITSKETLSKFSGELALLGEEISEDTAVKVFVITGSGKDFFSMEEDLINTLCHGDETSQKHFSPIAEIVAKIELPVIAAINGDATGQGLELALACDLRIASETSRFGFPQIKRGVIPWDGGTQRLTRTVGKTKAMEMILTGDYIDAKEAHRTRLVSRLVPHLELMQVVLDMAKEMASKAPIALRYAKEAINKGMDLTLGQGLRLEADLYFLMHTTKDRTEGIQAFQEKRKGNFEGK